MPGLPWVREFVYADMHQPPQGAGAGGGEPPPPAWVPSALPASGAYHLYYTSGTTGHGP